MVRGGGEKPGFPRRGTFHPPFERPEEADSMAPAGGGGRTEEKRTRWFRWSVSGCAVREKSSGESSSWLAGSFGESGVFRSR